MLIPEDKISEILNASDIVDVISDAVTLKKSGQNYFGLCPFHSEKTPSFSVSPDKQIFHCFGCSVGGNVFSFIMKHHGLSFPEAANLLARKYGIHLESVVLNPAEKKKLVLKEGLFRVNQRVRDFFTEHLKENSGAAAARDYLEKRGLTSEIIDTFGIGYAPDSWDSVVVLLKKIKLSRNVAEASGLVLKRKSGSGYYDRFRNRIIFPILDVNMQVAGFGGRVMDDAMPKYLNSPETPVYSKGRILYGLHAARQYCRKQGNVYIVEGYFDFLSLFQSGIKNCAATLGTALTAAHVRLLKGYAPRMTLVFDSDDAGVNAAGRSVDIFMKEGVEVRILILPRGQDPDSFISDHGKDAFESAAQKAMSVMEFLTHISVNKHGLSIEGKVAVLEDMSHHLAAVQESVSRSLYIRDISHRLGIDEKAILEKVRRIISENRGLAGRKRAPANWSREPDTKWNRESDTKWNRESDAKWNRESAGLNRDSTGWNREPTAGWNRNSVRQDGKSAESSRDSVVWNNQLTTEMTGNKFKVTGSTALEISGGCDGVHGSPGRMESDRRESQIVSMMLHFPCIIDEIKKRDVLDCFYSSRFQALGRLVIEVAASGQSERVVPDAMAAAKSEEVRELIASLAMIEMSDVGDVLEKSVSLMNRVLHVRQKNENSLTNEIRKIEQSSDADLPLELLRQRQIEIRKLRGYK